jgi:hypothetical protein
MLMESIRKDKEIEKVKKSWQERLRGRRGETADKETHVDETGHELDRPVLFLHGPVSYGLSVCL